MERSNDDMQQLRETLAAQTTAADAAIAHKDSELQVKERELQEFAAQTQQKDVQMQQKDAELADIAVQLEHTVLEVQEKETALGLKMAELKALREEADGVQRALSHDATNKSVEIAAHVHTIAQLHMALEQGVKALTDKDKVLTDKDKALTDKDKALTDKNGQLEAAVTTLDEHSLRLSETQVALAANESALQDLHQQMTEAEEEHVSGNTELQLQIDSLKEEIAEAQKKSACASATADRHVVTIAELQDSLSSKTNACSDMLQQLRAKTEECKELGADVQRRNEREERLQKDVQRETGSNTSLHTKLEALEERCVCCVCLLVCMVCMFAGMHAYLSFGLLEHVSRMSVCVCASGSILAATGAYVCVSYADM